MPWSRKENVQFSVFSGTKQVHGFPDRNNFFIFADTGSLRVDSLLFLRSRYSRLTREVKETEEMFVSCMARLMIWLGLRLNIVRSLWMEVSRAKVEFDKMRVVISLSSLLT